jgi:hypothetical protein
MDFDYNLIQKKCREWYERNVPSRSPFSKLSKSSLDYANYLSELVGNNAKFKEFELTSLKDEKFSFPEYAFFIGIPSFEPLNNRHDIKSLKSGKWNYSGHIVRLKGQDISCELTPSLVSESELEHIVKPKTK